MLNDAIYKLRQEKKLTQEEFAEIFGVSRQAVQKWENNSSVPELSKIIEISNYFGISLDALILNRNSRAVEELNYNKRIVPSYENMQYWESYSFDIMTEYEQSIDEGLDIEHYKDLFKATAALKNDEIKNDFSNILQKIVINAKTRNDYKYTEPSDLEGIKRLRKEYPLKGRIDGNIEEKIYGAWIGRICGCMLGKTVECIHSDELTAFLKESGNYPMHRYIKRTDLKPDNLKNYTFAFNQRTYADEINGMPVDDDTNYTVLAQLIIEKYGRNFTPYDVSREWLVQQGKDAYCSAERVAYCNFIKGYVPPESAIHKNPFREWIGAQIRGDYWGYINPGNPELAAEMAWRDASISHVKNGIYGEMFASAMLAAAYVTNDTEEIILSGLAQIPYTSRLYEAVISIVERYRLGKSQKETFDYIHKQYDEYTNYGWCHTIPNAMIVAASLLYGNGDYGKSICMAVEAAFDTDCNGATVGSVLGMANGINSIASDWTKPINDTLHTSIFDVGTVKISDRVKITMSHIE